MSGGTWTYDKSIQKILATVLSCECQFCSSGTLKTLSVLRLNSGHSQWIVILFYSRKKICRTNPFIHCPSVYSVCSKQSGFSQKYGSHTHRASVWIQVTDHFKAKPSSPCRPLIYKPLYTQLDLQDDMNLHWGLSGTASVPSRSPASGSTPPPTDSTEKHTFKRNNIWKHALNC